VNNPFNPKRLTQLRGPHACAGVFFGDSSLDLAVTRAVGGGIDVLKQTAATLPAGEEVTEPKARWKSAAQALRQQIDPREHSIVTAIGCEDTLCHTLTLPTTEPGELKQMLDLQIDNLTPLPLEEVVYSFQPLEVVNGQTRVLVAIARKDAVNERVEALETAGLQPECVTVDALAVLRTLVEKGIVPRDNKLNTLVLLTATAMNVVVHSRGLPVAVRSIVCGPDLLNSEGGQASLREELQWTLAAVEADVQHGGIGRVSFLTWTEAMRTTALQLAAACEPPADFLANGSAPSAALSLCLDHTAVGAGKVQLNLLPDQWRQQRHVAQTRQRLVRGAIAIGAVYLLVLIAFLSVMELRKVQLRKVGTQIQDLKAEYTQARELRSTLIAMQKQFDTKYSALEVLREVSVMMPESLKLNQFVFKKDQTVTLRGQAPSASIAIDFQSRLEKSPFFSKVTAGQIRGDPAAGGLTRFEIVCSLKSSTGTPGGSDGAK
jgi:type II secretory pathway component PulL